MRSPTNFLDDLKAEQLYLSAAGFVSIAVLLMVIILIYQTQKRGKIVRERKVRMRLEDWISELILDDNLDVSKLSIPEDLAPFFRNIDNSQFVIDLLIDIRKSFAGHTSDNDLKLYDYFDLKRRSVQKLEGMQWHEKAQGIYELAMMNQSDMQGKISRFTDSENDSVRMEAQSAIISFSGFEGLNFLDSLTKPLPEWQQIKLIERLYTFEAANLPDFSKWLLSNNDYVVLFSLKLIALYQQFHLHDDVVESLRHSNIKIRKQAILALATIANSETAALLVNQYREEDYANKKVILAVLEDLASDEEMSFLLEELNNTDDSIKLMTARIFAKAYSEEGLNVLREKALDSPYPYVHILNHVEGEL